MDTQNNKEDTKRMDSNKENVELPRICPWCGKDITKAPVVEPETEDYDNYIRSVLARQPFRKIYKIKTIEITFQEIPVDVSFKLLEEVRKYDNENILLAMEEKTAVHLFHKLPYALYKVIWNGEEIITPDTPVVQKKQFINGLPEAVYNLFLQQYMHFNSLHMKLISESTDPNFFLKET